jgi:hypothetical protein
MNDSPISTKSAQAAEGNSVLPRADALQIAALASVPDPDFERFYDYLCNSVQMVCDLDRRAVSSPEPSRALIKAAEASRTLFEAVYRMNKDDREWVDNVAAKHPFLSQNERLRGAKGIFEKDELAAIVWQISMLFDTAINKSSPPPPGTFAAAMLNGEKRTIFRDSMFNTIVRAIFSATDEAGGDLPTFDKNNDKGELDDVLNILRKRLPKGVIPNVLPRSTIQKIKTQYLKDRRRL